MLIEEFRVVVKGWKIEVPYGARTAERAEFTSHHPTTKLEWAEHTRDVEAARIGEDLPNWHPHITDVYIECREVTEWRKVDR